MLELNLQKRKLLQRAAIADLTKLNRLADLTKLIGRLPRLQL